MILFFFLWGKIILTIATINDIITDIICQSFPINRIFCQDSFSLEQKKKVSTVRKWRRLTKAEAHYTMTFLNRSAYQLLVYNGLVDRYNVDTYFVIPSSSFSGRSRECGNLHGSRRVQICRSPAQSCVAHFPHAHSQFNSCATRDAYRVR